MDTKTCKNGGRLIPPPETVRVELARSVRESRRLRALLRLSLLSEDDRRFLASLRPRTATRREGGSR